MTEQATHTSKEHMVTVPFRGLTGGWAIEVFGSNAKMMKGSISRTFFLILAVSLSGSVLGFALKPNTCARPSLLQSRRVRPFRSTPNHSNDNSDNTMFDSIATIASKAFAGVEFDASLDDATRIEYEAEIAAEFDRTMREMEAMGEELKGENDEMLKALAEVAAKRRLEIEKEAVPIEEYERKVKTLTDRVKLASGNVEKEVETLKALQVELQTDPILRLSNYREQPLARKVFLAASLLFFLRGSFDGLTGLTSVENGNANFLSKKNLRYSNLSQPLFQLIPTARRFCFGSYSSWTLYCVSLCVPLSIVTVAGMYRHELVISNAMQSLLALTDVETGRCLCGV